MRGLSVVKVSIDILARHWPLASLRQARRQAVRLMRAQRYLRERGIAAHMVGSTFEYRSAPKVLS